MLTRRDFCLSAPGLLAMPATAAPRDAIRKSADAALKAGPGA